MMSILSNKWIVIIFVIIAIFGVLLIIGKKSVRSEISINAPVEKVWSVITNTSSYAEWNSVMLVLEGKIKEGNKVKYKFTQEANNSYDIPSKVVSVEEGKLLNQYGGTKTILTFDHKYILVKEGIKTKLIIHEEYRGIMVPFWNPDPVGKAYERLCTDIKNRAESLKL